MLPTIMAEIFKNNRQEETKELHRETQEIEREMLLTTIVAEIFKNNRRQEEKKGRKEELEWETKEIERPNALSETDILWKI